jgi:DNA-binding transcriptional ArsR family regulator
MGRNHAETFKVLAGESRIRIIELLKRKGPLCVTEVSQALGMTPSAISQHLKALRHAGLVRNERDGYWTRYDVDPAALERCNESLAQVCNCGCRGSCRLQEADSTPTEDDLSLLRKREGELRAELREVRARIRKIRGKA